jgi:tRNA-dihydrouridine synthase
MIQEDEDEMPEDWKEVFYQFLQLLLESQLKESSNEGNVMIKMKHFWEYFSASFDDETSVYRKIKKANSIQHYSEIVEEICSYTD